MNQFGYEPISIWYLNLVIVEKFDYKIYDLWNNIEQGYQVSKLPI